MEFTSKEFNVILRALNDYINHLRKQIAFAKEQLEKNQSNDELVTLIEKTLIREKQQLEDAEMTLSKFLGIKK